VITFQAFLRIIHSLRSFTAAVARFVTAAAAFSRLTIGNSSLTTAPAGSKSLRDDDAEMSEEALRRRRKRGRAGGRRKDGGLPKRSGEKDFCQEAVNDLSTAARRERPPRQAGGGGRRTARQLINRTERQVSSRTVRQPTCCELLRHRLWNASETRASDEISGRKNSNKCIAVRHTATGTHMPHGITQCYLPPGRGDIPALTPAEAATRLNDPGGMQG